MKTTKNNRTTTTQMRIHKSYNDLRTRLLDKQSANGLFPIYRGALYYR